jgi:hypothetical protein
MRAVIIDVSLASLPTPELDVSMPLLPPETPPSFIFRKPASADLVEDWKSKRAARNERARATELRHENERRLRHQTVLRFWPKVGVLY